MNSWSSLEHNIFRHLGPKFATHERGLEQVYGVAVSGGPDSVSLLHCLQKLKKPLNLNLLILHVHHGDHENREFRDKAERFVQELALQNGLPIEVFKNTNSEFCNEAELRELRRQFFTNWQQQSKNHAAVFLGHHADDLLETRMIRLLRGVGEQGLESMTMFSTEQGLQLIRPFLELKKSEILEELKFQKHSYLLDPSAEDLRSWLRQIWFPQLEARLPGALQALARSLQNLSEKTEKAEKFIPEIRKVNYFASSVEAQRQWIAGCLRWHRKTDYTKGQIQEVQKRLDKNQIEHTFEISGLKWVVDAAKITSCLVE